MSLPLLSSPPVSQNARVTSFAVGGDETPRQVQQSIGRNAARVDDLIEQAYRQIFFHAFKVDRDAALESQLRSSQITVRDFVRGLLRSRSSATTSTAATATTAWSTKSSAALLAARCMGTGNASPSRS